MTPDILTREPVSADGFLLKGDENDDRSLVVAKEWERQNGDFAPVLDTIAGDGGEIPVYNYQYRCDLPGNGHDVPEHHVYIANLVVQGLTLEEIEAVRRESRATIKKILSHWPVKQYILRQLTRAKMAVKVIQESKLEQRRQLADKGFEGIEKVLTQDVKANTAYVKAAQIAMSLHPERAYEPAKETVGEEAPQDTQSLNSFYEMHAKKLRQAQAHNAEFTVSEDIDVSGEIEHTTPQDVEESVDD
jgi:hypothetical protein